MSKEHKYKNEQQKHELNYNLRKNGCKETKKNRDMLKTLADLTKLIGDKKTLTNKDYDKIIEKHKESFEKK